MALKIWIAVCIIFAAFLFVDAGTKRHRIFKNYACEGRSLRIDCRKDRIFIIKADYGRWNASVCPYYDDPDMDLHCHQPLAQDKVIRVCENKNYCKFKADNDFFTNPCPGQIKYAEVYYTCMSKWLMMGYQFLSEQELEENRQKLLPDHVSHFN